MNDVVIIGAGPIGLACGIEAEKRNFNYLILDKGPLVNSIYNYPLNMSFFSTSDKLEIGNVPFISHQPKPTRAEALEYYRRVSSYWELNTHLYDGVKSIERNKDHFVVKTAKNIHQAANIVVATGFYDAPYLLNVPGENLPKVLHYYREPHPFFDMDLVVVGAANSAVDVALETYRKGAKSVTMLIRESEIAANVKYWVRPDIINRINEGSIKAHFNTTMTAITETEVFFKNNMGKQKIENDFVLAMTGYQPNFGLLESLGVTFKDNEHKTPKYNPKTMESFAPGVYLAGVVCGGYKTNKWFIENSRDHATLIMEAIEK